MGVLEDRRVVITGAGRGIGRAIATAMAAEGARLVLAARSRVQLIDAADELRDEGAEVYVVPCDITSDVQVRDLATEAHGLLGAPVDTVVNNAGVYQSARFADIDMDTWSDVLDVNVVGSARVTKAFLPQLLENERSRVVMIASIAGLKGSFGQAAYNASKHAQIGMTRCLALEYGRTGLTVNAVCPGFVLTDLIDIDELAQTQAKSASDVWRDIENVATIGRTVTVDEVASMALYLASPAADGINGQSLAVDGGVVY